MMSNPRRIGREMHDPLPSGLFGPHFRILDRYLMRELIRAAFAVTIVLLLLIASKLFMQQLGYLMEGKFSTGIVYELLGNKLLAYFVQMPVSYTHLTLPTKRIV